MTKPHFSDQYPYFEDQFPKKCKVLLQGFEECRNAPRLYGVFHITATGRLHSDLVLPTTKHERVLDIPTFSYETAMGKPRSE